MLPSEDGFLDFVRMLLGEARALNWIAEPQHGQGSGATRTRPVGLPGILEALVKCAADEPERLKEIAVAFNDLLSAKGVVPEPFRLLWEELHQATNRQPRSPSPRNGK
jgi:hypothetical protein